MRKEIITAPAHGSNVARADIPAQYKWHTHDIFPNEAAWQAECASFKTKLPILQSFQGTLTTATQLLAALKLQDEMSMQLDKIYAYAGLQKDADSTDQHIQSLVGIAANLVATFSSSNSFIEPEMLALGEARLAQMRQEEPALETYDFYIENFLRLNKHILAADKESMFAKGRLATSASATIFSTLTNADMEFPTITDGEGKETTISNGNYMLNMTSPDRELRKNSFLGLHKAYGKLRNTLAATLTGSAQAAYYYANVHNYKDTLESCLAEDNIPASLYDGLIDTVHANLEPLHEYIQLKKDFLGYDELHYYDLYYPLSKPEVSDSFSCSFEEACAKVEEALQPLGEEYLAVLHKGFTEGWIDTYENKGKRSGAYSWGVYGVHPFVLLNYQPRYSSISTIAHELGHSLHSYFSSHNQPYIKADYTIFCAEVASTTNENLLLEHTLKTANPEQKIFLLNQFLEQVRTTVYRQVQFAEFEKFIHNEIAQGRSLQAETLENYWLESNKRYYGPALTLDKELAHEWSRIPHYYTPFYVYKYATGYSAATAFAAAILSGKQEARDKYLGFLKAGGSDYSLNLLKNAGVDLTTPQPVTVTLNKFAVKLTEFKQLLGR